MYNTRDPPQSQDQVVNNHPFVSIYLLKQSNVSDMIDLPSH
jgi:hypothetical protein